MKVVFWANVTFCIIIMVFGEFGEPFCLRLTGKIVHRSKNCTLDRESHPGFSEKWVTQSSLRLHWLELICTKCADSSIEKDLLPLKLLIVQNSLSIVSIISVLKLDTFDLVFSFSQISIWDLPNFFLRLKFGVHVLYLKTK